MGRLILLISLLLAVSVEGDTFYVKPTGSSENAGTSLEEAWASINSSMDDVEAGDTVLIRSGYWDEETLYDGIFIAGTHDSVFTYNDISGAGCGEGYGTMPCGPMVITVSGTSGNPIVFKGYPGERPYLKGNKDGDYSSYGIIINDQSYLTLDSIELSHSWRGASAFGTCSTLVFKNMVVHHTAGPNNSNNGGFFMTYGGSDPWPDSVFFCRISNCTTYFNGEMSAGGGLPVLYGFNTGGFYSYRSNRCVIENSVFHDEYNGIRLKGGNTSDTISGNLIYDCKYGIYLGKPVDSTVIHHNVIYNTTYNSIFALVDDPRPCDSIIIYNNTLVTTGSTYESIKIGSSADNTYPKLAIFNNICMNTSGSLRIIYDHDDESIIDYNDYYRIGGSNVVQWVSTWFTLINHVATNNVDLHTVSVDPLLADTANHNFHLTESSPSSVRTGGRGGEWPIYMGAFEPTLVNTQLSGSVNLSGKVDIGE